MTSVAAQSGSAPVLVWPVGRAEMLYERFKQCIIARQWLPGQQLNIDRLAREYNVSITPVREALARLSADKLVMATQHRGYTVAPPPSTARMAELFAVRLLLEPPAARGAALHISPHELDSLRALHEAIAARGAGADYAAMQAFAERNRAFHELIFRINGNDVLSEVYGQLNYHVVIGHVFHVHGVPDVPEVMAEHAAILDALAAHDPDAAAQAMRVHIERGSQRLLAIYRGPTSVAGDRDARRRVSTPEGR
jgi:DNA-binding GntR family transcriptional regulator